MRRRSSGDLFRREAVGGAIALVAAVVGIVWANSAWAASYFELRHVEIGPLDVEHWAADGALTLFFFVAGLELKRELVVGSLRRPADAAVPVAAAVCGVAVPALLYLAINANGGHPEGWAVPAATDIAFALAVLAVVGSNLPTALRAFLLTLAVVDDLIVIVIIAVFFTDSLDLVWLAVALAAMVAWALLQRRAGVDAADLRAAGRAGLVGRARVRHPRDHRRCRARPADPGPARPRRGDQPGRAPRARAVAGVLGRGGAVLRADVGRRRARRRGRAGAATRSSSASSWASWSASRSASSLGGWLVARFTRAELDPSISWRDVVGVAVLAGIGFTVSLLVSDLSFAGAERDAAKTAVLAGSVVSAVLGALVLGHRDRFRATP